MLEPRIKLVSWQDALSAANSDIHLRTTAHISKEIQRTWGGI
jgi:hypothetical protein